jgi:hypothetical protein
VSCVSVASQEQSTVKMMGVGVVKAVEHAAGLLCTTSKNDVRSHSHDSSFMHSDVSLFYSYTVVAETHFAIVTVPLVSLFMP